MHLVAAPDKFRGTLDAIEAASAIAEAARSARWTADEAPLSDGGEGFGTVLGGTPSPIRVSGPLGQPVDSRFWVLDDPTICVVEMAEASGRALLPHPTPDEAFSASTEGVGQLILAAISSGASTIIVGCGGSATTDGGWGAVTTILDGGGLAGSHLVVATDVTTAYLDAARTFGPQKGADSSTVARMERRLEVLGRRLGELTGRTIASLPRSGAAGGLAGGLMALGAEAASGIDVVAGLIDLDARIAAADLVVTGEGRLDATSLEGKTVASLVDRIPPSTRLAVIAGSCEAGIADRLGDLRGSEVEVISLTELVGAERSEDDARAAVVEATEVLLA